MPLPTSKKCELPNTDHWLFSTLADIVSWESAKFSCDGKTTRIILIYEKIERA